MSFAFVAFGVKPELTFHKIFDAMYNDGTCTSTTASDGTITRDPCPDAYGRLLGMNLT